MALSSSGIMHGADVQAFVIVSCGGIPFASKHQHYQALRARCISVRVSRCRLERRSMLRHCWAPG